MQSPSRIHIERGSKACVCRISLTCGSTNNRSNCQAHGILPHFNLQSSHLNTCYCHPFWETKQSLCARNIPASRDRLIQCPIAHHMKCFKVLIRIFATAKPFLKGPYPYFKIPNIIFLWGVVKSLDHSQKRLSNRIRRARSKAQCRYEPLDCHKPSVQSRTSQGPSQDSREQKENKITGTSSDHPPTKEKLTAQRGRGTYPKSIWKD